MSLAGLSALVTGGAGFVGSHLVEKLLAEDVAVTVVDNASTGTLSFLTDHPKLRIVHGDLLDETVLNEVVAGHDVVFHLAANADIRHGAEHPGLDVVQNVIATQKLLEAMRHTNVRQIVFASSGAVYGNSRTTPIFEDAPFPTQTSFYGASKIAAEAIISAYSEAFDVYATVFRFTPMLGERYSHGHIYDFVKNLLSDSSQLHILGNGLVRKYCVYVDDAMDAFMLPLYKSLPNYSVFNVGNDQFYTIDQSVDWVCESLAVKPERTYSGNQWAGDNQNLYLDFGRLRGLGWRPQTPLKEAVQRTVRYLLEHSQLLERT